MTDDAAPIEIVPLTPDRWDDMAVLFGEGGDPKQCWCMYWRVRSNGWRVGGAAESRDRMHALVDAEQDPAPGLLAYRDGRVVGWVSVAPREDYDRLVHSRVRPKLDDVPDLDRMDEVDAPHVDGNAVAPAPAGCAGVSGLVHPLHDGAAMHVAAEVDVSGLCQKSQDALPLHGWTPHSRLKT